jgi:hypothetical protein
MSIYTAVQLLGLGLMLLIWSVIALLPVSLGFALTVSLARTLKFRVADPGLAVGSELQTESWTTAFDQSAKPSQPESQT